MKKPLLILLCSLAVNAALAVIFVSRNPASQAASRSVAGAKKPAAGQAKAATATASAASAAETAKVIAAADLPGFVAQLKAMGFPPQMITTILRARLSEIYADRGRAIYGDLGELPPFWSSKATLSAYLLDPERQAASRALSNEMNAAMKELLGADFNAPTTEEQLASYRRSYGDLPIEKIAQLQAVMTDFSQRQQDIRGLQSLGYSITLPEDRDRLVQLDKDRRDAIVALFTPQELEEYDMRSSSTASVVRSQLTAFEPSEEEFRTIYRIQKAFDDKYPNPTTASPNLNEMIQQRNAHQQELQAEIAATLSPDRAADYKLALEPGAAQLSRVLTRLELPKSAVGDVISVQKDIQSRATALRTDRSLTADMRNQQLADLAGEATSRLTQTLGETGLEVYKTNGGAWVQNLVPRPAPLPPGAPTSAAPLRTTN